MIYLKYLTFILLILITATACSEEKKIPRNKDMVIPTSESKLLKIFSYDDQGRIQTVITGIRNVVFRNSKEIWLDHIRVLHITRENTKLVRIQLTADKGKVNYKTLFCEAWSNAVAIRENEIRIETERMFWNNDEKKIYTKPDEKVLIFKRTNPEDKTDMAMVKSMGKNLIADNALKTIELDRAVSAPPEKLTENF